MFELVHQYIREVTVDRIEALNKKGYLFTVYYFDGTVDKVVSLSWLYKTPTFRATKKIDTKYKAHFVADNDTYFKYWDAKRDKDCKIILSDSRVEVTDDAAKAIMMAELLKQRDERWAKAQNKLQLIRLELYLMRQTLFWHSHII